MERDEAKRYGEIHTNKRETRQRDMENCTQLLVYRWIDRKTDRQTDRQTHRQIDRQIDRE